MTSATTRSAPQKTTTPINIPTLSPEPTSLTAVSAIETPIPQNTLDIGWDIFKHDESGVSIEYPAGWQIIDFSSKAVEYYFYDFFPANDRGSPLLVSLSIFPHKDTAFESTVNPYLQQPNEGGYEIQWIQPFSFGSFQGLEYVWGALGGDNQWDTRPDLYIVTYSTIELMEIHLDTSFNDEQLESIATIGMTETVVSEFEIFHHMAHSITK